MPRPIGAFYHVWKWHNVQRARSEMRRYTTIQVMTARTIAGLPRITVMCPGWWKQSFWLRLWSLVWFQERATSCHLTSSKSAWKSTTKCTWMWWRVWWSPGAIRWLVVDPECGSRIRRRLTSPKRTRLGFWRSATTLYQSLLPLPEPTGLVRLVKRREHHQHDLPQHQSQPDRRHPPSIGRASTDACGKGMLPVPDPYRGGDLGWRRLHWIDISSTTKSNYLNRFFE